MNFIDCLDQKLQEQFLLKHPFYQAWVDGKLTLDCLRVYAQQYFHHVLAFPRYISAAHMNCSDLASRQVLLENLIEEEHGEKHHPGLWLQLTRGLNLSDDAVADAALFPETKQLIDTFMNLAKSSYCEGVGALYAYERQTPQVATSKIEGLKKHYGIDDENTIEFFVVHQAADVWHSDATKDLLTKLSAPEQEKAMTAAVQAAGALWNFLSGVQRETLDRLTIH